jgi:hypothetical protein
MKKFAFTVLLFLSISIASITNANHSSNDKICIHGGYWGKLYDQNGNGHFGLVSKLKQYGLNLQEVYRINIPKDYRCFVIYEILPNFIRDHANNSNENTVLFLWEPPSVLKSNYNKNYHKYFSKIYTWNDDLVDNKKYFKFCYPQGDKNQFFIRKSTKSFEEKKLCTLIARNYYSGYYNENYSERRKTIAFFENNALQDFDLYGYFWDKNINQSYCGITGNKIDCLTNYRFNICYENTKNIRGYVTEKIFDSFKAGCVPVYWGASNITDYVPENCFIDRRKFANNASLYSYLKSMKEEEHDKYIKNISAFLGSDKIIKFTDQKFVETFFKAVGIE